MANFMLSITVCRMALPFLLTISIVFRPCVLSGIYLLFLLYLPFVPLPSTTTMKGHTGIYLKTLITFSFLIALSQIVFQIVLFAMPPYGHFLENCEILERILRTVGYVRLNNMLPASLATWIAPEIIMTVGSVVVYIVSRELAREKPVNVEEQGLSRTCSKTKIQAIIMIVPFGKYLTVVSLCIAAILRPSVQGGLYFLIFLSSCTWWACYKELRRGFAIVLHCLMIVVFLHIIALFVYQMQWPQEFLNPTNMYARYFGLTVLLTVNCSDPRDFLWTHAEWASYANPLALIWLYFLLAIESKHLLGTQLICGTASPSNKHGSEIPMGTLGTVEGEEERKLTWLDHTFYATKSLGQIITRFAYIATNILMMTWSIAFHSWITFVLLLWANILWMVPNQRRAMFRCSPFLVLYACFLLISAYIYSMNLTEEELPSVVNNVDLALFGFEKNQVLPCKDLFIKCLFTSMFWRTMRQYMQERRESRQNRTLANMGAPLPLTVEVTNRKQQSNTTMKIISRYATHFLTKFWIWIVAITLFGVAITGTRMTFFRIVYMALFLIFVITFQLSYRIWRKIMLGFWITIILYSMIVLILTYTYQFANIREYWSDNLHVSKTLQLDIGLQDFGTKLLFIRLLTPTSFVIITAIQLHYFHKRFSKDSSARSGNGKPINGKTDAENSDTDFDSAYEQQWFAKFFIRVRHTSNVFFLILEIHLPKLLLLLAMLLCVYDKCAIYLVIVVLLTLSFLFGRAVYIFTIYSCSILASLVILARMVYQIAYVQHDNWRATCLMKLDNDVATYKTTVENEAEWFGFKKSNDNVTFTSLIKWNLVLVVAVTIWAVILVRQYNYRLARGRPTTRASLMFPEVTRTDADKNVKSCLKYLANYGFYKFGVEICLLATVALIGVRMDPCAIIYAVWIIILYICSRATLRKIWPIYLSFIAISIPVQYVMLIGLPPSLCVAFSWRFWVVYSRLQYWFYLMDFHYLPPDKKLLCDFLLLMLVSRQSLAFRIESHHINKEYPGGSNDIITHHVEEKGFVNPVPDYITYCRSYLDIIKRTLYLSFMWISLAFVFLAGTSRVNIFSIGYLLCSFIFLWQGLDTYLRPLPNIIKSWDYLAGYNMTVIFVKTVLQVVGCLFIQTLRKHACWFVHLFAIGCVEKFRDYSDQLQPDDPEKCKVSRAHIGLLWDGICFGFLLFQRRLFNSYNFFHVINETKAATILASRGAELIEELTQKRLKEQEEGERTILQKIKAKMDRIKASQHKILGPTNKEGSHFVAIRSGNYYMFDELDDDEELKLLVESPSQLLNEDEVPERGSTVGKLISSTLKTDIRTTVRANEAEILRRSSAPLRPARPRAPVAGGSQASSTRSAPPAIGGRRRAVVIIDPKDKQKASQPDIRNQGQPSTSKDDEISELSEPREDTFCQKIKNYLLFIWIFMESLMVSCIRFLNRHSKDYNYILRILNGEKKTLKEKTDYTVGVRSGRRHVWQPAGSYETILQKARIPAIIRNKENIEKKAPSSRRDDLDEKNRRNFTLSRQSSPVRFIEDVEGAEMSSVDQPTIARLGLALWHLTLSHSQIFCYFIIFVNQVQSTTILSLPLPMMVFLWGTLTVPRPSKNFWITIIAYTEIIVLIKCILQFDFLPSDRSELISAFYSTSAIEGSREYYAFWDLLILLIVFFHRYMLKCLGLWKSTKTIQGLKQDPNSGSKNSSSNKKDGKLLEEPLGAESNNKVGRTRPNDKNVSFEAENVKAGFCKRSKCTRSVKEFFHQLMNPTSQIANDVYAYMFFCDFFNFFVLVIGYTAFDEASQGGDEGAKFYLKENQVPVLFLLKLMLQFTLIIIDRGIYLRKYIFGKIVFQFLQIFMLHVWFLLTYWNITETGFTSLLLPQMYYMVKCFYLLLSAYQIRCGYPTRILGYFICKGYNYVNMFLFKAFMAIPFIFELRSVMDWMWTGTSMSICEWIKMEFIFSSIFGLKCTRHNEIEYPEERGKRKSPVLKYLLGGVILILIFAILWFPLILFSLKNAVGKSNVLYDITISLKIGQYEPIYQMSVQSIHTFNTSDLNKMLTTYRNNEDALRFLHNYEATDIAAVKFNTDSAAIWIISPTDRIRMLAEFHSERDVTIRLQYIVSHKTNTKDDSGLIREIVELHLKPKINGHSNPTRDALLQMLVNSTGADPVPLSHLVPKFIKVTKRGTAKAVNKLMNKVVDDKDKMYRNITILRETLNGHPDEWWEVKEDCSDSNYKKYLQFLPYSDECNSIIMYIFHDKIFPSELNFITAGGIIGLYTTIVLVAGRVLRTLLGGMYFKFMLEDMPNVDRVLQLCYDVYLVRAVRQFSLEEDLYAKLVFLFRSPETLIRWTQPRRENGNQNDNRR